MPHLGAYGRITLCLVINLLKYGYRPSALSPSSVIFITQTDKISYPNGSADQNLGKNFRNVDPNELVGRFWINFLKILTQTKSDGSEKTHKLLIREKVFGTIKHRNSKRKTPKPQIFALRAALGHDIISAVKQSNVIFFENRREAAKFFRAFLRYFRRF